MAVNTSKTLFLLPAVLIMAMTALMPAADQPQWGQRYSRNMVSSETGLPASFDPATGTHVKWVAELGTQTYSTPVIGGGKILIGTNNDRPRDERRKGDLGVLLCLNESDGSFCWQLVAPKLTDDIYKDWPRIGMCACATIEGERAYMITNRGAIVCLDMQGQANGNDGPFTQEAAAALPPDQQPVELSASDADIIWQFDVPAEVGVFPHDGASGSILIHGDYLYVNTSSGLNNKHAVVRSPEAPVLIVLNKHTGRWLARDNEAIGPAIFHGAWSSPALGEIGGKPQIFYGGPNGVVYGFEPYVATPESEGTVVNLKRIWRFDCDPNAPKDNVHQYVGNREVSPSTIENLPVFYNNRVYVTVGGDIWWGKKQSWLQCIRADKQDDITATGLVWSYSMPVYCVSTPAIAEGLVYIADCDGVVHCVDAETGKGCWTHEVKGEIWSSVLAADGKVFIGSRSRDLCILQAGREKKILSTVTLDSGIIGTPVAANGTLYITTMKKLYAIGGK